MAYLTVAKETRDELVLKKSPGLYSWIVTAGIFLSLEIFAYQQSKNFGSLWWWTPASVVVALYIAVTSLEKWETCDFSKVRRNVRLTSQSLLEKVLQNNIQSVVIELNNIIDVQVEETVLKYVKKKARVVTLISDEGHNYYLTQSWTTDPASEHNEICQTIKEFLDIKD